VIEVKNCTMLYSSKKGITDVSFQVKEGEVFGYLGPNGAGKTTTIRCMLGFMKAQSGRSSLTDVTAGRMLRRFRQMSDISPVRCHCLMK
jgi:ABC-2 type transport system ATP-binding protein